MLSINGILYPDPIRIATFTGIPYTNFPLGSVVVARDTGEIRSVGPTSWITYVGSFAGGQSIAQPYGFVPGTMYFTLAAPAQAIVVPNTMLPGVPEIALGGAASTTIDGFVSTIHAAFNVAGTAVAGTTATTIDGIIVNAVRLKDAATNEPIETPTGEEVFGLLQALNGSVDGDAVAANPAENLQISFVYWTKIVGPPPAPVLTSYILPIGTYIFAPNVHSQIIGLSYAGLLGNSAPLPDVVTRIFYVPTFVGVVYTDYPQGAIVIAMNTDERRQVGATSWIRMYNGFVTPVVGDDIALTDNDGITTITMNCDGNPHTITLPVLANNIGREITCIKIDAGAVNMIVDGNGSTINGAAQFTTNIQWVSITVQAAALGWYIK